jgi:hypothetical protein
MTTLRFPGQLPDDMSVAPGGCAFGGYRCVLAAELLVTIPGTDEERPLCREHAGWSMFHAAAADVERTTEVLIRLVA